MGKCEDATSRRFAYKLEISDASRRLDRVEAQHATRPFELNVD